MFTDGPFRKPNLPTFNNVNILGEAWVKKLYTSRYMARALPISQINAPNSQANNQALLNLSSEQTAAMNRAMYDTLRPKFLMLLDLEKFQDLLAKKFVQVTTVWGKKQAPKAFYQRLVYLIDVLARLDLVKVCSLGSAPTFLGTFC